MKAAGMAFAVLQLEGYFRHVFKPAFGLCDEHAAVNLGTMDGRMRMSADDDIGFGKGFRQLYIRFVAVVGQQNQHVAPFAQPCILAGYFFWRTECDAFHGKGMSIGNPLRIDL